MVKTAAALGASAAAFPLTLVLLLAAVDQPSAPAQAPSASGLGAGVASAAADALGGAPAPEAEKDIPPGYLVLYMDAVQTCPGLPWTVLAGIGTVESDNGVSQLPGVRSGANYAGAQGPMQFLPATFAEYAVNADPGQPVTPYDPADAVYTAAAMLCANGARGGSPSGIEQAVFAYNHAGWYVEEVMARAGSYAAQNTGGHRLRPSETAVAFARAQLGKPYQWGAQGPASYDCSGLAWAAYAAAGIHIARTTYQWQQDGPIVPLSQIQPGDLVFYAGSDGTPASPGHVVMYLGHDQVIQAPHTGTDVQTGRLDRAGVIVITRPSGLPAHP